MTMGAGKYDAEATLVREATGAHTVLVIVIGGERGTGFSFQTEDPRILIKVPALLKSVARQIDKDLHR